MDDDRISCLAQRREVFAPVIRQTRSVIGPNRGFFDDLMSGSKGWFSTFFLRDNGSTAPHRQRFCRGEKGPLPGRELALIVGAGSELSASRARRAAREGVDVVLAARNALMLATLTAPRPARRRSLATPSGGSISSWIMPAAGRAARSPSSIPTRSPTAISTCIASSQRLGRRNRVAPVESRRSEAKPPGGGLVPAIDVLKRRMAVEEWVPGPTAGRGIYRSGLQ